MRRARPVLVLSAALITVSFSARVRAEPSAPAQHYSAAGAVYTLSTTAFVLVAETSKGSWAPAECRWCDPGALDIGVRRAMKWRDTFAAGLTGDLTAAVLEPLVAFGGLGLASTQLPPSHFWDDVWMVAEAAATSLAVTEVTKASVARERPRVYGLSPQARVGRVATSEDNLSFFSGHTSFTFALACASGSVAARRGYPLAPWIWGSGLGLAGFTGYLRIAADAHYLSDVLVGGAIGCGLGIGMPALMHRTLLEKSARLVPIVSRERAELSLDLRF